MAAPWPRRWGPCLGRRDSHADQGAVATQFSSSTGTGTSPIQTSPRNWFGVAQQQGEGRAHAPSGRPCLPLRVRVGQARGAWSVPGRDGGLFVGEEHAIPDVPAARYGSERGRAVEPAVNAARPVAAGPAGGWGVGGAPGPAPSAAPP